MERDRRPLYIWLLFAIADALLSAYYWPRLPAVVAQHFDRSGHPDAWGTRAGLYLMMWALILGMGAIFLLAPKGIRWLPFALVNVPYKRYWEATPERQQEALDIVEQHLAWLAVAVIALHSVLFLELLRLAASGVPRFPADEFIAVMAVFLVFAAAWGVVLVRRFKPPETP
ncbi:MAG: DUF1648 domain-containing protein [Candidatus Koribacter versatilis]|uniref:DUF1648 domain-containing protein n=1 Tax=Candidatus Korobacter versatilis TaxID=658062 RepID=A0A932A9Y2_9BACT|nr:DUF1648 domain-containing protein [Candidatus Koribacter versatilis]